MNKPNSSEVVRTLAETLSFIKTLETYPDLTIRDLQRILLSAAEERSASEPPETQAEQSGTKAPKKPQKTEKKRRKAETIRVYTDGACRGNPGESGAGAVFYGSNDDIISRHYLYLGRATNNVAEYKALIMSLEIAVERNYESLQVLSDSQLMCLQMSGSWRVKDSKIKVLHTRARELSDRLEDVKYTHVPRAKNKIADELANMAIDRRDESKSPAGTPNLFDDK